MKKLFKKDSGEEHNFWMSYTDLMSGFLVVFIILSAILFNHFSRKSGETEESRIMYDSLIIKYNTAIEDLKNSGRDIDSCLVANAKLRFKTDSLTHVIDNLRKNDMKNLVLKIDSLTHVIDSLRKNDMKNLVLQYTEFAGIKGDIRVVVDKSKGSIVLYHRNNDELFSSGGCVPQKALKEFLNQYGKSIIAKTISLKQKYPRIELRIEGHTDPVGQYGQEYGGDASFVYNMGLSSQRANSVYSYLYNSQKVSLNEQEKAFLRNHAISVGYSFSERIKNGTHSNRMSYGYLDDASRRIEFRIIAK